MIVCSEVDSHVRTCGALSRRVVVPGGLRNLEFRPARVRPWVTSSAFQVRYNAGPKPTLIEQRGVLHPYRAGASAMARALGFDEASRHPRGGRLAVLITKVAKREAGIHRIWLDLGDPAEAPVACARKALGPIRGRAVRFEAAQRRTALVVGEGVETMRPKAHGPTPARNPPPEQGENQCRAPDIRNKKRMN